MGTRNHLEPTAPAPALPVGRGGLGGSRCGRTGWAADHAWLSARSLIPGLGHRSWNSLGPRGLGIA